VRPRRKVDAAGGDLVGIRGAKYFAVNLEQATPTLGFYADGMRAVLGLTAWLTQPRFESL